MQARSVEDLRANWDEFNRIFPGNIAEFLRNEWFTDSEIVRWAKPFRDQILNLGYRGNSLSESILIV